MATTIDSVVFLAARDNLLREVGGEIGAITTYLEALCKAQQQLMDPPGLMAGSELAELAQAIMECSGSGNRLMILLHARRYREAAAREGANAATH